MNRNLFRLCLPVLAVSLSGVATPATVQPPLNAKAFHEKVQSFYSFAPHELTSAQIEAKSKELDAFWSMVMGEKRAYLGHLRSEVADVSNSRFFAYDGAKLLLEISKEPKDLQIAADSISRADLRDVDHADYLRTLHHLRLRGIDTTAGAFRLLDTTDFKAFIPQHSLTLAQNYGFIYLIFQSEEKAIVPKVIQRLTVETSALSQKTLLLTLWYTCLPEARTALLAFKDDASRSDEVRSYARELFERPFPKPQAKDFPQIRELRKRRRACLSVISDEALLEFDRLTLKIAKR